MKFITRCLIGILTLLPAMGMAEDITTQDGLAAYIRTLSTVEVPETDLSCRAYQQGVYHIEIQDCAITFKESVDFSGIPHGTQVHTTADLAQMSVLLDNQTQQPYTFGEGHKAAIRLRRCSDEKLANLGSIRFETTSTTGFQTITEMNLEVLPKDREWQTEPDVYDSGSRFSFMLPGIADETTLQELVAAISEYRDRFCTNIG